MSAEQRRQIKDKCRLNGLQRRLEVASAGPVKPEDAALVEAFGLCKQRTDQVVSSGRHARAALDIGGDAGVVHMTIDQRRTTERDHDMLLGSYLVQQAKGLSDFMDPAIPEHGLDCVLFGIVIDDANMWVQRPPGFVSLKRAREPPAVAAAGPAAAGHGGIGPAAKVAKVRNDGRNVHIPVCNLMEVIVTVRGDISAAAEVLTPGIAMPQGNWGTIEKHFQKWSLCNGVSPGSSICPLRESALVGRMATIPWPTFQITRDRHLSNTCLVSSLRYHAEQTAAHSPESTVRDFTVLDMDCFAHNIMLTMKPIYLRVPGLVTHLTQLGHCFEASRTWSIFIEQVRRIMRSENGFRYRRVRALPPEAAAWRRDAERLLRLTSCAQDMSEEDIAEVLRMDNGCWDDDVMTHYCVINCCATKEIAFQKFEDSLLLTLKGGPCVPLFYRWKGVEQACGWTYRNRRRHRVLERAFTAMHKQKDLQDAEAEVHAAAAAGDENLTAKARLRAKKIIDYILADPAAQLLNRALQLTSPLQKHLNVLLKTEKWVTKYTDALLDTPRDAAEESKEAEEAGKEVDALHTRLLGDEDLHRILRHITALLKDFTDEKWTLAGMARDEQYLTSRDMVCACGVLWRRQILYVEEPKCRLMKAALEHDVLIDAANRIAGERAECQQCIDSFTWSWVQRLQAPATSARASRALQKMRRVLRLTSARVERKHLIGQEAFLKKSRGRAPTTEVLGRRTLLQAIRRSHSSRFERIRSRHLPRDHSLVLSFNRQLLGLARKQSRKRKRISGMLHTRKLRKTAAWHLFRREQRSPAIRVSDTAAMAAEEKRLAAKWKSLTESERGPYHGRAAEENNRLDLVSEAVSRDGYKGLEAGRGMLPGSRDVQRRMLRKAAIITSDRIARDPAWHAGSALGCPQAALKPTEVMAGMQKAQLRNISEKAFAFQAKPTPNPRKDTHERTCAAKFGGICRGDRFAHKARLFTENLWSQLNAQGLRKDSDYPLILDMDLLKTDEVDEAGAFGDFRKQCFLLLDMVGKGDLAVVCALTVVRGAGVAEVLEPAAEIREGRAQILPTSSQRALRHWLRQLSGEAAERVQEVHVSAALCRDAGDNCYRVTRAPEPATFTLNLRLTQKPRKRPAPGIDPFGCNINQVQQAPQDGVEEEDEADERIRDSDGNGCDTAEELESEGEHIVPLSPADVDEVDPLPAPPSPGPPPHDFEIGLLDIEVAPSSRAMCCFCNVAIASGDLRFVYKLRKGTKESYRMRCHLPCASSWPMEMNDNNLNATRALLLQDRPNDQVTALEALEASLLARLAVVDDT